MKKMKRLAALFLAVVMVMAMGMTAFAVEGDGTGTPKTSTSTITIVKPIQATNEDGDTIPTTYTAYKIFNVKTATIGEGESAKEVASYTRPQKDDAGNDIAKLPETETLKNLFDVVDNGGDDIYYNPKSNITAKDLEDYLSTPIEEGEGRSTIIAKKYCLASRTTTYTGAEGTNVISNVETGYYFVKSSVGTKAMLNAVGEGNTEITEKNTTSGWGEEGGKQSYRKVWVDKNENSKEDDGEVTYVKDAFYAIGDTVTYEVTYKAAQNYTAVTEKNAEGIDVTTTRKVYQYVVNDVMPDGVTLNPDSIEIVVTEAGGAVHKIETKTDEITRGEEGLGTYSGSITSKGINITIPWSKTIDATEVEDFYFKNVPAEIKIKYTANVTKDVKAGEALTNTIRIAPNEIKNTDDEKKVNKIYTGSLDVLKYDSTGIDETKLNDEELKKAVDGAAKLDKAVFVVAKGTEETTAEGKTKVTITGYLVRAKDGDEEGKISWSNTITDDVYRLETGKDGKSINGPLEGLDRLDKDTYYYLVEIQAPEGYNLLTDPVKVTIAIDETVITENEKILDSETATDAEKKTAKENIKNALVMIPSVGNKTGAVLPSTGGIGTTIFYVVGGIMVLGAGVLLITKKRMSAK